MRGAALDVLRRMDAHDAVVEASTQMRGAQLVDRDGNVIGEMSGDDFGHRVGGDLEIVRGDLCEILMEQAGDVDVAFGDVIENISESRLRRVRPADAPIHQRKPPARDPIGRPDDAGSRGGSAELSGSEIESTIDSSTERIAEAANAIALKDYSAYIHT